MTYANRDPRPSQGGDPLPERFSRVAQRVAAVQDRLVRLERLAAEQRAASRPPDARPESGSA